MPIPDLPSNDICLPKKYDYTNCNALAVTVHVYRSTVSSIKLYHFEVRLNSVVCSAGSARYVAIRTTVQYYSTTDYRLQTTGTTVV